MSNKMNVYDYLQSNSLPCKRFCLLSDYNASVGFTFPVIVKRNLEKEEVYKYKYSRFESNSQLMAFIDSIPKDYREYLIVQEAVTEDAVDLDFRGYVNEGMIISSSLVREIRSYTPGVPSYLEEVQDIRVIERINRIVSVLVGSVSYTGFIGVDIKYDGKDGIYILDVNTRPPASISCWIYKFSKEERVHFIEKINGPMEPANASSDNIRWVNTTRDILARIKTHDTKGLVKSITAKKDLKYPGDSKPYWFSLYYVFKRNIRLSLSNKRNVIE